MKKIERMALEILQNMDNILMDEDDRPEIRQLCSDGHIDESFFTAELLALRLQYSKLTGDNDMDLLDFISLLNKLAVQYIMDDEKDGDEG